MSITSPSSGSTVGGTITVTAQASPLALVVGVQFKLDGANLGAEDTSSPFAVPWNTLTASNGSHTLTAVARNALGLQFTSDPVPVTVFNDTTPPTVSITSPSSGSTVSGVVGVSANASDNVGVVGVQFQLDGANLGAEDTTAPYSVSWDTGTAADGTHTLRAVARDAAGNTATSAPVSVVKDTTPPTVSITSPSSGATVSGTIAVSANATDAVGVVGVQFQLDGAPLGAEDTTAPYSVTWDTSAAAPGTHSLTAVARDAAGNTATSSTVTVTVSDTTPPTVGITSPSSGATVSGTIPVSANASDNVGVAGVQFRLDGAPLGAEDTTAPYSVTWDTTAAAPSTHSLTAVARDAAGNTATSSTVTVTVSDTTPPTVGITSPSSGATVSGTIPVSASASDNVAVAGVQFRLDGAPLGAEDTTAPYSVSWDTTGAGNGTHTLSAEARDAAGNTATAASVSVTVSNGQPPDATPPTVGITSPSSGATVTGTITVSANASDDVGVAGVQFQLDGAPLGAEDTTAPYSVTWDTTTAAPGTHSLTAIARDAAGNTATSSAVSVSVSNDGPVSGDVFVAIINVPGGGRVQWHKPDGTLRGTLTSAHDGQISSLAFDANQNLYVPHWWGSALGIPGNTVTRRDPSLNFIGSFGSGYNSSPSSITFDPAGNVYVGQADDSGDILKFDPAGNPLASFNVAVGNRGTDHIDLAADGCTMFYTSRTKDVFRYNVCTNTQLPFFNTQPLPGENAYHVRVLPDGGVLVADDEMIVRLDASGNQAQLYVAPGEPNFWGGVDHAGDGTFWASNAYSGNIYKFDLASGAVLASFNTGTGLFTAAGLAVKP